MENEAYALQNIASSMLKLAINDAKRFKNPRSFDEFPLKKKMRFIPKEGEKMHTVYQIEVDSWDARRFLNPNHEVFVLCCEILDYDPIFFAEQAWKTISASDKKKNRKKKSAPKGAKVRGVVKVKKTKL